MSALKTYGYEPDPHMVEIFTKYRKTHNDAVFDAYTARSGAAATRTSSPVCPTPTVVGASSGIIGGSRCMASIA